MTVRIFGRERTAARLLLAMAALAMSVAAPVEAQQDEASAPSSSRPSIDFRLPPAEDTRAPGVQGPSDNGLPPLAPGDRRGPSSPPTPQPSAPRVVPTQPPAASATPAPAPEQPRPSRDAAAAPAESRNAEPSETDAESTPETLPDESPSQPEAATPAPEAPVSPASAPVSAEDAPVPAAPVDGGDGAPLWAWLLAAFAALGAGVWYWRRRPVPAADEPAGPVETFEPAPRPAPVSAPVPSPRAATPPQPAASPPQPAAPSPAPAAPVRSPVPAPRAASPLVTRPADEQRAAVAMTLEIHDIRITAEQVTVALSIHLVNRGPVAAMGLMVRIALGQGSAMPEGVLARFFDGAGGSVLRDNIALEPGAGERLSTDVMLPRALVEPLMIGDRPMLVPVMALDVTYHWDGPGEAFGQNAASFVLGREQGEAGGRLAPVPLDRVPHRVSTPGHRATAMRREQ